MSKNIRPIHTGERLNRHVGRAVRDSMRPDPPGAAEERIRARHAGEQANREMMAKFAPLTADNAGEAIKWQDARIRELLGTR